MDAEIQQFMRVTCRLTVPRLNHLINLINSWSMGSIEYEHGVIVQGVYNWVLGSIGLKLDGCGGSGGFGRNDLQGLGGNDQQALQPEVVKVSDNEEDEVAIDEDHEAGHDHQGKRKRKMEQKKKKKQKIQKI